MHYAYVNENNSNNDDTCINRMYIYQVLTEH